MCLTSHWMRSVNMRFPELRVPGPSPAHHPTPPNNVSIVPQMKRTSPLSPQRRGSSAIPLSPNCSRRLCQAVELASQAVFVVGRNLVGQALGSSSQPRGADLEPIQGKG